jgi:predicted tellurium resistance membrane protein TerC
MDFLTGFFDVMSTSEGFIAFLMLTLLEIVLGIDNIVFLSIIAARAPIHKQRKVRVVGLFMAMILRIVMLFGLAYIVHVEEPLFVLFGNAFSIKDVILLAGGIFLVGKSTTEIHHKLSSAGMLGDHKEEKSKAKKATDAIGGLLVQIALINIIFSLDSLLTAIGLTKDVPTMISAIILSTAFMMIFAGVVSTFITNNPTIIMLALSFLIMIGTLLVAEAFHIHFPREYVYFAMGFALFVEVLNVVLLRRMRQGAEKKNESKVED